MASESRETRLNQKAALETKLQKRMTVLAEKGQDPKAIASDVLVKELKAKLKENAACLKAIDANVQKTAELAALKAERLAKPKEERPKGSKKSAPEPPPEAKGKKKKKKDDEAKPQKG